MTEYRACKESLVNRGAIHFDEFSRAIQPPGEIVNKKCCWIFPGPTLSGIELQDNSERFSLQFWPLGNPSAHPLQSKLKYGDLS